MSQAALIHHPDGPEIWRRFLLAGPGRAINAAPWMDAYAQGHPVGTCRRCGGYLKPGKPYRPAGSTRDLYPAVCDSCGRDTAAAGPRPTRKKRKH